MVGSSRPDDDDYTTRNIPVVPYELEGGARFLVPVSVSRHRYAGLLHTRGKVKAECLCGWKSRPTRSTRTALRRLRRHKRKQNKHDGFQGRGSFQNLIPRTGKQ